jgi:hypothetical protein
MKFNEPVDLLKLLAPGRCFYGRQIISEIVDSLVDLEMVINSGHV